ncbi:MAG: hypothetical protein KC616_24370, partial [Myxococcales bacterium]|nr:hypothetical protein [Myxococcales bacterium]
PEEPPPGLARSTGTESPSSAPADPSLPPPAPERGRPDVAPLPPAPVLDPSARWLDGDDASEYWTLYVELDSGHRISQRFLLTNAGPGEHTAVAVGHLTEPGRPPFRYENGRREGSWTASPDRLFFDIAASHLDLHRPRGELRITKDEIEIRLFFDFPERGGVAVPRDRLPPSYAIDVLAIASPTEGTILAPWMTTPLATRGRTWLAHTWMSRDEAELVDRRIDVYGSGAQGHFYGLQLVRGQGFERAWYVLRDRRGRALDGGGNPPASWQETWPAGGPRGSYPIPSLVRFSDLTRSGRIHLGSEWLRYDPLDVIPQPFQWFFRRKSRPQEVWADARIEVTVAPAPETPSLPQSGESESPTNSKRETEDEAAHRSVTGVASITFLNPSSGR